MLEQRNYSDQYDDADNEQIFKETKIQEYEADSWSHQMERLSVFMETSTENDLINQAEQTLIHCLDHPCVKAILDKAIEAEAALDYSQQLERRDNY
jgi:Fe-S-cluster-containing hydrogenase component 2